MVKKSHSFKVKRQVLTVAEMNDAEKSTLKFINRYEITLENVISHEKLSIMLKHVLKSGVKAGIFPSDSINYHMDYIFKVNNRFRKILGKCTYKNKTDLIQLSGVLLKYGDLIHIVQTLMHEFCHLTVFRILHNGYKDGESNFERLIKCSNSESTGTTRIKLPRHIYVSNCGCYFSYRIKLDLSSYVCNHGNEIHYLGYFNLEDIEILQKEGWIR